MCVSCLFAAFGRECRGQTFHDDRFYNLYMRAGINAERYLRSVVWRSLEHLRVLAVVHLLHGIRQATMLLDADLTTLRAGNSKRDRYVVITLISSITF